MPGVLWRGLRIGAAELVRGTAWPVRTFLDGGYDFVAALYAFADWIEGR